MTDRYWEICQMIYCKHIDSQVALEIELIYTAEHLPEQRPRLLVHRCSHGTQCSLSEISACVWAEPNPNFDPFKEKLTIN